MGTPGRPFNWQAPFFVAFAATFGIAVAYGLIQLFLIAGNVFLLIGLALFLAVGMEPAVSWLVNRNCPAGSASSSWWR